MAQWTHALCIKCWNTEHPDKPASYLYDGPREHCCMCSDPTQAGIYIRRDPATVQYDRGEER